MGCVEGIYVWVRAWVRAFASRENRGAFISGTQLEFESGDALGSSVESGRRLSGERSDASPHIITRLRAVSPLRGHARTLAGWGALRH